MAADTRETNEKLKSTIKKRSWQAIEPPLSDWVLDAVHGLGFKQTTPVQASTIPLFMTHKDVVVEAVTGSGKTLAFVIPIVEKILRLEERTKKHHVASIIISPTRELASQIHGVLLSLLAFHQSSSTIINSGNATEDKTPVIVPQLLVGGQQTTTDDLRLFMSQSPNVLISTPGRLLELLSSPHVHCPQSSFEMLILDEADRLLDMGFKDDLQRILTRLPKQRRTGLFSASVSEAVDQIVRVGLRNPVKISVKVKGIEGSGDQRTPTSLRMCYRVCKASERLSILSKLLTHLQPAPLRTIVYFSTCAAVDYFQHVLAPLLPDVDGLSINLVPLHGKHQPSVRQKNFKAFSESTRSAVLLTTDLAARGLDIPQVDLVVQIDPPSDPKAFLHRCGRAGRAGRKGLSLIFLQPGGEEDFVDFLRVRKTPVTPLTDPSISLEAVSSTTSSIHNTVLTDRALHDKAQRGFVSWARAYSKHQASSIFRLSDIDWADNAHAWGLLKLPKMPELKGWSGDRSLGNGDIDWAAYAYKDRQREKVRLQALEEAQSGDKESRSKAPQRPMAGDKRPSTSAAWSQQTEAHQIKEMRRSRKKAKRDHERAATMTAAEKQEQSDLQAMIEEVRQRNEQARQAGGGEGEFEGFDD